MELDDKKGHVYILVNPAFSGLVKIGRTTKEPESRARELSSGSGVPSPYAVAWHALVTDCEHVERLIHQKLAHARTRNDREFFAVPLKEAISIVSNIVRPYSCNEEHPKRTVKPNRPTERLAKPKNYDLLSSIFSYALEKVLQITIISIKILFALIKIAIILIVGVIKIIVIPTFWGLLTFFTMLFAFIALGKMEPRKRRRF